MLSTGPALRGIEGAIAAAGIHPAGEVQLLAMVRRLYVQGWCLIGDSVDRARQWRVSTRDVVTALEQVLWAADGGEKLNVQ